MTENQLSKDCSWTLPCCLSQAQKLPIFCGYLVILIQLHRWQSHFLWEQNTMWWYRFITVMLLVLILPLFGF